MLVSGTTKRCVCLYLELCVCMHGVHVYWIMAGGHCSYFLGV